MSCSGMRCAMDSMGRTLATLQNMITRPLRNSLTRQNTDATLPLGGVNSPVRLA